MAIILFLFEGKFQFGFFTGFKIETALVLLLYDLYQETHTEYMNLLVSPGRFLLVVIFI